MNPKFRPLSRLSNFIKDIFKNNEKELSATIAETDIETVVKKIDCQALFSYSILLPEFSEEEKQMIIIGSFIIQNTGTEELNYPILCFRVSPPRAGTLGGKIVIHEHLTDAPSHEQWQHVHKDWREKIKESGEYWLKPKHCERIKPGESLQFTNFEFICSNFKQNPSLSIEGFVYFKEIQNGIQSANSIMIQA